MNKCPMDNLPHYPSRCYWGHWSQHLQCPIMKTWRKFLDAKKMLCFHRALLLFFILETLYLIHLTNAYHLPVLRQGAVSYNRDSE